MERSEQINDLAAALAKAQSAFVPVGKTGRNPHLKSNYVTIDGIIEMTRKPLSDAGLSYVQMLDADGESLPVLTTMLMHLSGQWLSSGVIVRAMGGKGTNELQELGRSITYMKRYALAAMLGVSSDEDTDGHGAKAAPKRQRQQAPRPPTQRQPAAKKPPTATQDQDGAFASMGAAIAWAIEQNVFDHPSHAGNSYKKLKEEKKPKDAQEMAQLWREKIANKLADKALADLTRRRNFSITNNPPRRPIQRVAGLAQRRRENAIPRHRKTTSPVDNRQHGPARQTRRRRARARHNCRETSRHPQARKTRRKWGLHFRNGREIGECLDTATLLW